MEGQLGVALLVIFMVMGSYGTFTHYRDEYDKYRLNAIVGDEYRFSTIMMGMILWCIITVVTSVLSVAILVDAFYPFLEWNI